jgi:site-specific recombinase XerD
MKSNSTTALAPLLQQFFVERLQKQRQASPCTIQAYRDAFRLFLTFVEAKLHKRPADLAIEDLTTQLILDFLDHLERHRKNSVRSRNARFAALRSFIQFVGFKDPAALALTHGVLGIPMKRFDRPQVGFLSREHIEAIVAAPDVSSWTGRRDRVLLATLYNTGARVSELIGARVEDVNLSSSPCLRLQGKGRKERSIPLWTSTASQLRQWIRQQPPTATSPLFPNRLGSKLSRTNVTERLQLAVRAATALHPELAKRKVTPHIFRHSLAMHLLQAGVDVSLIALWLGHESPATTHIYVEADLAMKEKTLKSLRPLTVKALRFRPSDQLMQFLNGL